MRDLDIEQLVQWAYRDELPKRGIGTLANRWDNVQAYGERGGMAIDDEPGFPAAMGAPHVDAVKIEHAVNGLNDEVMLDWPRMRGLLLSDISGIAPREDPLAGRVFSESALVASFARMGMRPRWDIGRPHPTPVTRKGVVMLVGECKGAARYTAGSHVPLRYVAPLVEQVAFRRAEYVVWRDGLARLAGVLRGWLLRDFTALPPAAPAEPWLDPAPLPRPAAITGLAPAYAWPPVALARGDRAIKSAANSDR